VSNASYSNFHQKHCFIATKLFFTFSFVLNGTHTVRHCGHCFKREREMKERELQLSLSGRQSNL
jgi:hypothetical protein